MAPGGGDTGEKRWGVTGAECENPKGLELLIPEKGKSMRNSYTIKNVLMKNSNKRHKYVAHKYDKNNNLVTFFPHIPNPAFDELLRGDATGNLSRGTTAAVGGMVGAAKFPAAVVAVVVKVRAAKFPTARRGGRDGPSAAAAAAAAIVVVRAAEAGARPTPRKFRAAAATGAVAAGREISAARGRGRGGAGAAPRAVCATAGAIRPATFIDAPTLFLMLAPTLAPTWATAGAAGRCGAGARAGGNDGAAPKNDAAAAARGEDGNEVRLEAGDRADWLCGGDG